MVRKKCASAGWSVSCSASVLRWCCSSIGGGVDLHPHRCRPRLRAPQGRGRARSNSFPGGASHRPDRRQHLRHARDRRPPAERPRRQADDRRRHREGEDRDPAAARADRADRLDRSRGRHRRQASATRALARGSGDAEEGGPAVDRRDPARDDRARPRRSSHRRAHGDRPDRPRRAGERHVADRHHDRGRTRLGQVRRQVGRGDRAARRARRRHSRSRCRSRRSITRT